MTPTCQQSETLPAPGRTPQRRRDLRGFTLLELVVVIVIIGVVAAVTVPRMVEGSMRYRVQSAACRIADDLNLAQRQARASSQAVTVTFKVSENTYELDGVPNPDRPGALYSVDLDLPPYETDLLAADFGGDAKVVFDGFGAADSGGSIVLGMRGFKTVVSLDAGTSKAVFLRSALQPEADTAPVLVKP